MRSILPFLLLGTPTAVILSGLILGGFLLDPDFIGLAGGITIALFFIEAVVIGFAGGCKLLPRQTKMESVDGGESWTIIEEKERSE